MHIDTYFFNFLTGRHYNCLDIYLFFSERYVVMPEKNAYLNVSYKNNSIRLKMHFLTTSETSVAFLDHGFCQPCQF